METGWSEANIDSGDFEEFVGCFLDLATVGSILDALVDGRAKRRILDTGQGERRYSISRGRPTASAVGGGQYRAP